MSDTPTPTPRMDEVTMGIIFGSFVQAIADRGKQLEHELAETKHALALSYKVSAEKDIEIDELRDRIHDEGK